MVDRHGSLARGRAATVPVGYVEEFFGICTGELQYIDKYGDCGARWIREDARWEEAEAVEGEWDWSRWDALYEAGRERGYAFLPILDYTPPWASTAPADAPERERDHSPPRDTGDWREFVERFVERYPDIEYFEVWNEPNLSHFLYADRPNHEVYVEKLLKPAAAVVHDHGKYVVAPSLTLEWPDTPGPSAGRNPGSWNVGANVRMLDRWLNYENAWKHVDYVSVHYTKGDAEKHGFPYAENLMPFYDHVYENWIEPGKIRGVWNTEEAHTAVEAGDSGFVAMEPWERAPYEQWAPRYVLPVLHWALRREWQHPDQYKLFWFKMGTGRGTLQAHNVIEETEDGYALTTTGRALRTASDALTDADRVGVYPGGVDVGFGLFSVVEGGADSPEDAWELDSYAFLLDDDIFVATWLDLPGIEFARHQSEGSKIQARIEGLDTDAVEVTTVDYVTGERGEATATEWHDDTLRVRLPRTPDPVLYFRVHT